MAAAVAGGGGGGGEGRFDGEGDVRMSDAEGISAEHCRSQDVDDDIFQLMQCKPPYKFCRL